MIDKSHIQKFYEMKKYKPSQKDIKSLSSAIKTYIPVISLLAHQKSINNAEDLENFIPYYANLLYQTYIENSSISSLLYKQQAIENLIRNPKLIQQEYAKVKDTPNTHTMYTANLMRSTRLALINSLSEVSEFEDFAKRYKITPNAKPEDFSNGNAPDFKKHYDLLMHLLKAKNLNEKILYMLKGELSLNADSVRDNLLKSFYVFGNYFNLLGFSDSYLSSYNYNSKKFGYEDLKYEKSTGSYSKDTLGLTEAFSSEYLQSLDLWDLCLFNTAWCNRFAKECSDLFNVTCTIASLDLWQDILDGNTSFNISDEVLADILRKATFLKKLMSESYTMLQNSLDQQALKYGNKVSETLTKDYSSYYEQLNNYIGKDYKAFFSNHLHGNNNFNENIYLLFPICNLEQLTYRNKDSILEPFIKYCLDNPQRVKNWGIVRNEIVNGEIIDAISSKKPMVTMWFDLEGFNFPFRFHVSVDTLIDLTMISNGNCLIPEYQGYEDFIIDGELIPANIIMPVPKRHEKIISDNVTNSDKNQDFWEHKLFLLNQAKFPKHLSQTIVTNKKRVVQSRLPVCYTDLKTGKRYCKINNKFQELEDDGRDGNQ